jgi:hypothetical protein
MSSFLIKYIDNTDYFEKKYSKNISREAEKNKESLPLILERVRETLK